MSSTIGTKFKITIFGESHGPAIGVTIQGLPSGTEIDMDELRKFMERRAPGRSKLTTGRREEDIPEFLSGTIGEGKLIATGTPIVSIIKNEDIRSRDYEEMKYVPRPGHADYPAFVKYGENGIMPGGGHFSGRLTAPLCIAGGIAKQVLERKSIFITSAIDEIGGFKDNFEAHVEETKAKGDSLGGIVSCRISGMPVGIGEPIFDGLESNISKAVFGIPAVKGIEFGDGFAVSSMKGSENNDAYYFDEEGRVRTKTNHAGGILGGLSNGSDILFRVAFKPTPSIAMEQESINLLSKKNVKFGIKGRHDPCIVLRALPCVEAAAAVTILDYLL